MMAGRRPEEPHSFGWRPPLLICVEFTGNQDLLASHVTWSTYQTMIRMLKRYDLNYRIEDRGGEDSISELARVPGRTIAFSGYPGIIYSGDDFSLIHPR